MNRKKVASMVIVVCIILFIYLLYVLYSINDIKKNIDDVAKGNVVVENGTPYARFRPDGDNDYTSDIICYFAYCGLKRGRIFITCVDVIIDNEGKIHKSRDWFKMEIEKQNGEWEAVRTVGVP